ncbi:MAG: hypothetical protein LBI70_02000 [Rickettsiales bacterium]|jgi:hypothetical protein|nr:hypothetical protein [Rickettsiales bacterium]
MSGDETENEKSGAGFKIFSKAEYDSMGPRLKSDEDLMLGAIESYMESPDTLESTFQICVGSYVCGSRLERSFMEDELANIGDVVMQAQNVLRKAYGLEKSATMADVEKYEEEERKKEYKGIDVFKKCQIPSNSTANTTNTLTAKTPASKNGMERGG